MVSLQILEFLVLRQLCVGYFRVSLQILGFSVACCSLCVGCLRFPCTNFRV
jgi:hypothetical protein